MPAQPDVLDRSKKQSLRAKGFIWLAWGLIIAAAILPRVIDLDVFFGRDELAIWPWADEFATAIHQGDLAGTLTTSDYPGIPMFWVQTFFLAFKYTFPALFPQPLLPFELISTDRSLSLLAERRLAAGLFVGLQVIVAVWLVQRLFGWTTALFSAIFLGLDPFSLTEARLLRLEMISAYFVCLSILAYWLYLRRRSLKWIVISGIMAGLGVSSKTSAGLLVPYIWLLLLLDLLWPNYLFGLTQTWTNGLKQLVGNGLLWAAGAIAAFWLIWPAMWVKPWAALQHLWLTGFAQAADRSVWGDKVFFWGQIIDGGDPGPLFYPVVLAFRTTPLTWIGTIAALLFLGLTCYNSFKTKPKRPLPWLATGALLLILYITVLIAELTFVISKVDRFLLIIFPPLSILSALGYTALLDWLGRFFPRLFISARAWLSAASVAVILAVQLAITAPTHPYYFTYWNPWLGGGRAAMDILPIGAGEGLDEAINYLNHQSGADTKTLVCGGSLPWCSGLFRGDSLRFAAYFSGEWATADYASFYISHLQRERYPTEVVDFFKQQTPLYQVELLNTTYAQVYRVPEIAHFAGQWNILDGLAQLLGYTLAPALAGGASAQPGETIEATIWWTNMGAGVNNLILRWVDETGYEWGRAGVLPMPEYTDISPEQRAIVAGTASLAIPPGTPPGLYFLRIGVVEPDRGQLLGQFELPPEADQLLVTTGPIFANSELLDIPQPVHQPLAPEITLLGYRRPEQVLTAAEPTWLTLFWQAAAPPPDYEVVLRLVDAAGQEVDRWQGKPAHGRYPTAQWRAGEIVRDVWALQVKPETPVGRYNLEIGLRQPGLTAIPGLTVQIPQLEVWPQPVSYDLPAMQAELRANFGNRLTLLGYDLYFDTAGSNQGALAPVFYWQSRADFEASFDLLLTLLNADTAEVIATWQVPLGVNQAKTFWKANEVVATIYQFEVEALAGGRYHLDIGLQNRATGQIEPVTGGTQSDSVRIEQIQDKVVVRVLD